MINLCILNLTLMLIICHESVNSYSENSPYLPIVVFFYLHKIKIRSFYDKGTCNRHEHVFNYDKWYIFFYYQVRLIPESWREREWFLSGSLLSEEMRHAESSADLPVISLRVWAKAAAPIHNFDSITPFETYIQWDRFFWSIMYIYFYYNIINIFD